MPYTSRSPFSEFQPYEDKSYEDQVHLLRRAEAEINRLEQLVEGNAQQADSITQQIHQLFLQLEEQQQKSDSEVQHWQQKLKEKDRTIDGLQVVVMKPLAEALEAARQQLALKQQRHTYDLQATEMQHTARVKEDSIRMETAKTEFQRKLQEVQRKASNAEEEVALRMADAERGWFRRAQEVELNWEKRLRDGFNQEKADWEAKLKVEEELLNSNFAQMKQDLLDELEQERQALEEQGQAASANMERKCAEWQVIRPAAGADRRARGSGAGRCGERRRRAIGARHSTLAVGGRGERAGRLRGHQLRGAARDPTRPSQASRGVPGHHQSLSMVSSYADLVLGQATAAKEWDFKHREQSLVDECTALSASFHAKKEHASKEADFKHREQSLVCQVREEYEVKVVAVQEEGRQLLKAQQHASAAELASAKQQEEALVQLRLHEWEAEREALLKEAENRQAEAVKVVEETETKKFEDQQKQHLEELTAERDRSNQSQILLSKNLVDRTSGGLANPRLALSAKRELELETIYQQQLAAAQRRWSQEMDLLELKWQSRERDLLELKWQSRVAEMMHSSPAPAHRAGSVLPKKASGATSAQQRQMEAALANSKDLVMAKQLGSKFQALQKSITPTKELPTPQSGASSRIGALMASMQLLNSDSSEQLKEQARRSMALSSKPLPHPSPNSPYGRLLSDLGVGAGAGASSGLYGSSVPASPMTAAASVPVSPLHQGAVGPSAMLQQQVDAVQASSTAALYAVGGNAALSTPTPGRASGYVGTTGHLGMGHGHSMLATNPNGVSPDLSDIDAKLRAAKAAINDLINASPNKPAPSPGGPRWQVAQGGSTGHRGATVSSILPFEPATPTKHSGLPVSH
eukprot:gene19843-26536_t